MKKLILVFCFISFPLVAKPLLVMYLLDNLRIVLSQITVCENGKGFKASAQRIDGLYISGCWSEEPGHPELIRINWHNGDFSILPKEDFVETEWNNK